MAQNNVHPQSVSGYGGEKSSTYAKARPSYPPEAYSLIRKSVAKPDNINVVEIGSGTGIFTRALLTHPDWANNIAALVAVEPNDGMRAVFAQQTTDPRVRLVYGVFERTGVEAGWADLIVMATAFHWCLDFEGAIAEFARILRPGGVVVALWYNEDRSAAKYVDEHWALHEAMKSQAPTPQHETYQKELWRTAFTTPPYLAHFVAPPEEVLIPFSVPYTDASFLDFVETFSFVAAMPDEERVGVREKVGEILRRGEGKVWLDKAQGVFEHPFYVRIVTFRKKE